MSYEEEMELIYSPKSREHFKEVISSYTIGNYRSAVVMLYALCICDLVYKLEELRDFYGDGSAKDILDEIKRTKDNNPKDSKWEQDLQKVASDNFHLLDVISKEHLDYLYFNRCLCAHPVLDSNSELYRPSRELVASLIRTALDDLLLKPSIFTKNVLENILLDIREKHTSIITRQDIFERYFKDTYLSRMQESMFLSVFTQIWKFAFCLDDDDCKKTRGSLVWLLSLMYKYKKDCVEKHIRQNHDKQFGFIDVDTTGEMLVCFLRTNPEVFTYLSDVTKETIKTFIESDVNYILRASFLYTNWKDFQEMVKKQNMTWQRYSKETIELFLQDCSANSCIKFGYEILIQLTKKAAYFTDADYSMDTYIKPYLQDFDKDLLYNLLDALNHNDQIIGSNRNYRTHSDMVCSKAYDLGFTKEEIAKKYPNALPIYYR